MRALLVCAGLLFMSACGTANTQPVPARDSVEATLTDEAAWWEHATSLIESTIRTYGGDRGLRASPLAQESTSGEFVQAGSNPALILQPSDEEAWSWPDAHVPDSYPVYTAPFTATSAGSAPSRVRNIPEDRSTWQLSEAEMREVLTLAGWETSLHEQALFVSSCESRWSPEAIGDSGSARGLFQVHKVWADYIELPWIAAFEPVANAQMALGAYTYSIAKGYEPWAQWAERCRP